MFFFLYYRFKPLKLNLPSYYRLMTIGGNGCIVATSSVMQLGILRDVGEIPSVVQPFLAMKDLLQ